MHTTQQVYDRYHIRLWRLFIARKDARIKAAYPETGGVELYLHNWYVCGGTAAGREPGASERAEAMIRAEWDQWHKVSKRGEREYARAEQNFRRAVAIDERAYGPKHSQTLSDVGTLAEFLRERGKMQEATALEKRLASGAK